MRMDINPLIADLMKYQDELIDTIMIAIGCVFRTMVNIDSGAKLPAVPDHGEQRFRADGDHFFG